MLLVFTILLICFTSRKNILTPQSNIFSFACISFAFMTCFGCFLSFLRGGGGGGGGGVGEGGGGVWEYNLQLVHICVQSAISLNFC